MLKQLLQLLLNTRTTPSEAAHNAAPGRIDIGISGQEYICPADGFVTASANAMNVGGFDMQLFRNGLSVQGGPQEVSVPAWTQSAMIPVALSCLRPSFNCLPRSFCKAKSLGLQNNQLLLSIRALIFLVQAPLISLPTPLRATAGRLLGAIQLQSQLLKSKSRTGRWHLLPYLTETLRELESVVTLKKGHRLSSCAVGEVQPIILFGSTKQVQTFNPLKGGALC